MVGGHWIGAVAYRELIVAFVTNFQIKRSARRIKLSEYFTPELAVLLLSFDCVDIN